MVSGLGLMRFMLNLRDRFFLDCCFVRWLAELGTISQFEDAVSLKMMDISDRLIDSFSLDDDGDLFILSHGKTWWANGLKMLIFNLLTVVLIEFGSLTIQSSPNF